MESNGQSIDQIKHSILNHIAFQELKSFGSHLEKNSLSPEQLKIFFATLWAFFQETPSGIVSLALRVHDYWVNIKPWDAMAKSAYILSAAVDEFGLEKVHKCFLPTHHQLFKETTGYFNITSDDLLNTNYILPAGREINFISNDYYRNQPLLQSLGFHLASELTSWHEFIYFFNGFLVNKQHYRVTCENDPALKFFLIHTIVEPTHLLNSEKIIYDFLNHDATSTSQIIQGAITYMNYYFKLFNELNEALFN